MLQTEAGDALRHGRRNGSVDFVGDAGDLRRVGIVVSLRFLEHVLEDLAKHQVRGVDFVARRSGIDC